MNPSNPMAFGSASKVDMFIFKLYIFIFPFAPKVRNNPSQNTKLNTNRAFIFDYSGSEVLFLAEITDAETLELKS